ncbi:hypothetical protein DBV15_03121 [Temnothorax longispinosus]|uniref:Uncharacterized protein n=1 Tax=Temnothorax longispinosus TaxID=300112 RepID=A0A4S2KPA9_9HYME|nr:hypothetical protein DBV15_03121 [Temnothorax longispinosus]
MRRRGRLLDLRVTTLLFYILYVYICAKINFVAMFLGDDSVRGDESTLISNHRSIIFVSRPLFSNRKTYSFYPTACGFRAYCRSCCASTLWVPLGPDPRCDRKYTVHHPTAGDSQGRVRVLIRLLLEHHEEAVVQFLDAGGLALPMCFQECAASRLQ